MHRHPIMFESPGCGTASDTSGGANGARRAAPNAPNAAAAENVPFAPRGAGVRAPVVRRFGTPTGTLLVMASMIGLGVFTTTGFLLRDLGSVSAVLAAWALGGALALCSALAYAELGTMFPVNGGEYQLLTRIYGPRVGFVAGWVSLLVGFSAPTAAAAVAFAEYTWGLLPLAPPLAVAVGVVVIMALLHGQNVQRGARAQNAATCLYWLGMLAFIVAGSLARGARPGLSDPGVPALTAMASPAFAVALVYVSFAYSGWNAAVYLAGEMRAPAQTIPRSLLLGTALTTAFYLGLNLVFLGSVAPSELVGVLDVGRVAARALFGERGASVMAGLVASAMLLAVAALIMTGPRVYETMGADYPRLGAWLERGRSRSRGPVAAIALQAGIACVLIASASFEALITYAGCMLSVFSALTIAGVFVLRRREPERPRPYRAWGHPWTSGAALALWAWMVVHALVARPLVLLASLATVLSGLLLYRVASAKGSGAPSPPRAGGSRDAAGEA